jgi:threonine/homoserine/homoserine lactone efflux protein
MDWVEFGALWTLNFLNLISPGPETALMIRNSSRFSRNVGLATGFGIVCSTMIHKTYSILGFGLLVSQTPWLFTTLKIVASVYLIYLGLRAFFPKKNKDGSLKIKGPGHLTPGGAFKMGFMMDILHPASSLVFISILAKTVSPETPMSVQAIYGGLLILTSITWYSTQAYLFSHGLLKNAIERYGHWLDWITGCVFIVYGVRLGFMEYMLNLIKHFSS